MPEMLDPRELLALGDFGEAAAAFEAALRADPDNAELRRGLAEACARSGETGRALRELRWLVSRHLEDGFVVMAQKAQRRITELLPDDPEERARLHRLDAEAEHFAVRTNAPRMPPKRRTLEIRHRDLRMGLFAELSDDEWEALCDELPAARHEQGSVIVREGSRDSSLYLVSSGEVRIVTEGPSGQELELASLRGGGFFGEVSLLRGVPRIATVIAQSPCEILEMSRAVFLRLSQRSPSVRRALEEEARARLAHWRRAKELEE